MISFKFIYFWNIFCIWRPFLMRSWKNCVGIATSSVPNFIVRIVRTLYDKTFSVVSHFSSNWSDVGIFRSDFRLHVILLVNMILLTYVLFSLHCQSHFSFRILWSMFSDRKSFSRSFWMHWWYIDVPEFSSWGSYLEDVNPPSAHHLSYLLDVDVERFQVHVKSW